MKTKREQLMKLHYQTACVETLYLWNKQDRSTFALLTRMLAILMGTIVPFFLDPIY